MSSTRATVIAVTSLSIEARIALGLGVSVICGQASQLVARLQTAVERGALGIISFGVAGGLAPNLVAGDWVVGLGVRTEYERYPADRAWSCRLLDTIPGSLHAEIVGVDAPITHSSEKLRLQARTGAKAVDMESHVAAPADSGRSCTVSTRARAAEWELGTLAPDNIVRHSRRAEITTLNGRFFAVWTHKTA